MLQMSELKEEDGRIRGNTRQKLRVFMCDDSTWNILLSKKQEESISEFIRQLIKKEEEDDG